MAPVVKFPKQFKGKWDRSKEVCRNIMLELNIRDDVIEEILIRLEHEHDLVKAPFDFKISFSDVEGLTDRQKDQFKSCCRAAEKNMNIQYNELSDKFLAQFLKLHIFYMIGIDKYKK